MTVYCDTENCEHNDDGFCRNEKLNINGLFCSSNLLCESENKEGND